MRICLAILISFLATGAVAVERGRDDGVSYAINVFGSRERDSIAELFRYPIKMPYPIPDIQTKEELVARFEELFDDELLAALDNSEPSEWSEVGWRGIMFRNGDLWIDEAGTVIKVNYVTEVQREKKKRIIEEQKRMLHQSVNEFRMPVLEWNIGKFHIRVDLMSDDTYRYSSWSEGKAINQEPDLVLHNGTVDYDGTGGNHSYEFRNGKYLYRCSVLLVGPEGTPPGTLEVFSRDKLILYKELAGPL